MKKFSQEVIEEVLKQAKKAYKKDEVPVGAIITKNNKIVSKGYNQRVSKSNALLHAEIVAIQRASKKLNNWRLDECELWVSLEPCLMCVGAILQARISKVYFFAKNEKEGAIISKYNILDDNKLPQKVKYEFIPVDDASIILKEFFRKKRG